GDLLREKEKRILLFAGPGNNGGDALVAARHLKQWWLDVAVVFTGDPSKLPDDAKMAFDAWRDAGGRTLTEIPPAFHADLIVDGLFGIGLQRPLEGRHAELVGWINSSHCPVLSIDVPSGLNADTGAILGHAVRARHTITFIGLKPGLLTLDGPDQAGEVHVDGLGIDPPDELVSGGWLIPASILGEVLAPRPRNSHKGSFGTVGIVGGAPGMAGAALLAGRAALKLGAGKVRVGLLADSPSVDPLQPELMLRPAQELLKMPELSCIACGPGLGQSQSAGHALSAVIEHPAPLVLDADALNLLASDPALQRGLRVRRMPTLLTPHPAEAARLLESTTPDIQADRVASALELARRFNASVVLKGCGSICALADGGWHVNVSGNPGMASAGMGDVLTGILAALLSQGAEAETALLAGVYL
ncbi:MAG: NAD(P)H-hydrate dehydratase, partial [Pseudomonadota bacterium]